MHFSNVTRFFHFVTQEHRESSWFKGDILAINMHNARIHNVNQSDWTFYFSLLFVVLQKN